jgi:glycyl-tRNA synthetase beta chain
MPTLLLEIGCEELPARACRDATQQLPRLVEQHVGRAPDEVYVTPRRLAFVVRGLPERTEDQWVKGPPLALREKAAAGFAKRYGISVEELEERAGFLGVMQPGKALAEELPAQLEAVVRGLQFAKPMRWGADLRFPRPVRAFVAYLDATALEVPIEGIPTRSETPGLRVTGGPIALAGAEGYADALRAASIEPDAAARRAKIVAELPEGWSDPHGKLEEVIYLVESPYVIESQFDERHLQLPERVIVTAMQSHQRYFPLGGNRFAIVANGGDPEVARRGHTAVLENRLDDAAFTFERDVQLGIEGLARELGKITFLARAGTFADKTARLARLVDALGGGEASAEAARLAKADQAAELVREFADLEGYIGAEYARLAGFPEGVCAAIEEQYLPDSAGGPLPTTEPGRVLSAGEKIDNLSVAFALGQQPTGSRDPYGLRRAAIGLCRLAVEGGLRIELRPLVDLAWRTLVEQGADVSERSPAEDVHDFVLERLEALLDVPVEYARATRAATGRHDIGTTARLTQALAALDDARLDRLHVPYTRAARLVAKEPESLPELDPSLFTEDAEREVAETVGRVDPQIADALGSGDVETALAVAEELARPVDRFFVDVLVMAEDERVRTNRLRLLRDVRDTLGRLADFSQIPRG